MEKSYQIKEQETIMSSGPEKKYILKIKDLPQENRPREKMIQSGPASLNLDELLMIILSSGTKKEGVMSMARRMINGYGDKALAEQKNPLLLMEEFHLPLSKACQLTAAIELGRRLFQKKIEGLNTVRTAKQAFARLSDMGHLNKEQFRGLYLNSRYQLLHEETISVGSVSSSLVHPREVYRPALQYGASAVILAHNHPSGSLNPSEEDLTVTEKMKEAGDILGLELLDHLIIAGNKFISLI